MTSHKNEISFTPSKMARRHMSVLIVDALETSNEDAHEAAAKLRSKARQVANSINEPSLDDLKLSVSRSLFADFLEQGWSIRTEEDKITIYQPSLRQFESETEAQMKQRIRKGFEAVSNRQLGEPSNQEFLKRMEEEREFNGRMVSIRDVIDDGSSLTAELRELANLKDPEFSSRLGQVIKPAVVVCFENDRCPHTGLRLQDIWRYFRHTWSLEYKLLPGRTMRLLVRNTARPNHPIIGITMLSSPTANLLSRDRWIGWTIDELIKGLLDQRWAPRDAGSALYSAIKSGISAIRTDDLVPPSALNFPKPEHFFVLDQIVHRASIGRKSDLTNDDKEKLVDIRGVNSGRITNAKWKELSGTSLFIKKRAEQLIPLLKALKTMKLLGFDSEPTAALYEALVASEGRKAIQTALNEIKKTRLASEVADLSVCGAIAPYNQIIGGKLVAAVMASKEVRALYQGRYGKQVSEIASQISGKRVMRPADIKLLTTTALYGVGSNQYSSLVLRQSKHVELDADLVWRKIDSSQGFTITHVSDETVALIRRLSLQFHGHRRINSVFGEGSSPRTRQIREGFNLLGINNDNLLRLPNKKKVYGIELCLGARQQLLGFGTSESNAESNQISQICAAWARRWLMPKIKDSQTLRSLSNFKKAEPSETLKVRASKFEHAVSEKA